MNPPSSRVDASLPAFTHLEAPPAWQTIDLLSDLHLQVATPRTCERLARHLRRTPADAVLILGDLVELWVGDDSRHEGFERAMHDMLAEASRHRYIGFMAGNRDFLLGDAMLESCGVHALADPLVLHAFGRSILLTHGDALCLDDEAYQRFRAQVRDPRWQAQFLARPLEERRRIGREIRDASEQRRSGSEVQPSAAYGDIDPAAALAWLGAAGAPTLIHGHTHRPGTDSLDSAHERWVLSDWDFESSTAAPRGDVIRLSAAGVQRTTPL